MKEFEKVTALDVYDAIAPIVGLDDLFGNAEWFGNAFEAVAEAYNRIDDLPEDMAEKWRGAVSGGAATAEEARRQEIRRVFMLYLRATLDMELDRLFRL